MQDHLAKNELIKHTAIIHSDNRELNLVDKKISNVLLKNAFEKLDITDLHSMKFMDIAQMIGWGADYSYTDILISIKKLTEIQITWNILGVDDVNDWTQSSLLASFKVKKNTGIVEYGYSPHFRKLLKHPSIYARLDILIQSTINKKYSLNLWELLKSQIQSGKATLNNNTYTSELFELSQFKSIVGVKDKFAYKEFKYFKRDILTPAIEEVNEKTDVYIINNIICKEGKNVTGLKFEFKTKESGSTIDIYSKEHNSLREELLSYNLSNKTIDNFFKDHTLENIKLSIQATFAWAKKNKLDISPAMFSAAIKNEYKPAAFEDKNVKNKDTSSNKKIVIKNEDDWFLEYETLFNNESEDTKAKIEEMCCAKYSLHSQLFQEEIKHWNRVEMYYSYIAGNNKS